MNTKLKSKLLFVIKVLVVVAFTYGFLYTETRHVDIHIHNQFSSRPKKTSIIEIMSWWGLEDIIEQIENEVHYVSSEPSARDSYKKLCDWYRQICAITKFSSNINDKQKLYYQALAINAFIKINAMGIPILDFVDNITIKSNNTKSRGYSSRNQIVLDVKSMIGYSEFFQVLIHELGHIVDFRYLIWTPTNPLDNNFTEFGKKTFPVDDPSLDFYKLSWINENTSTSYVTYKDFVSWYSRKDIYEDFAESFNFYQNYNSIFRQLAKNSDILASKYDFLDTIFWNQFINTWNKKSEQYQTDPDYRPYDTTRF